MHTNDPVSISPTSVSAGTSRGRLRGHRRGIAAMALGAAGVVFGDIGTSSLYAIQQTFGAHGLPVNKINVFGVLSLMIWSLIMVVSVKFGVFILRADTRVRAGSWR